MVSGRATAYATAGVADGAADGAADADGAAVEAADATGAIAFALGGCGGLLAAKGLSVVRSADAMPWPILSAMIASLMYVYVCRWSLGWSHEAAHCVVALFLVASRVALLRAAPLAPPAGDSKAKGD